MTLMQLVLLMIGVFCIYAYTQFRPIAKFQYIIQYGVIIVGIYLVIGAFYNMVMFTDNVEVSKLDGEIYGIYNDGTYNYYGWGDSVQLARYWKNPVRYVRYDIGGGYTWNFTERSQDGQLVNVGCIAYWDIDKNSDNLKWKTIHELIKTQGVDWPQRFLKPSEDYIRNGIQTHTWQEVLDGKYYNLDYMIDFERKYTIQKYGIYMSSVSYVHLVNTELETDFWDKREEAQINKIAASYGIDTESDYDYADYVLPTPTPKTYNSYYKDGISYGEGLCNDGTCYDTHEELVKALIDELNTSKS